MSAVTQRIISEYQQRIGNLSESAIRLKEFLLLLSAFYNLFLIVYSQEIHIILNSYNTSRIPKESLDSEQ